MRFTVLLIAFLGWMFAGLEISLFPLIHRPMMLDLLRGDSPVDEAVVKQWVAWYQAAFLFGAAAGGWLFGWLGDRVGRRVSLALSVLCYSLFALACYAAAGPRGMLVLRFLACMGIGGTWPNAVALASEAWPDASRPLLAGLLGAAANVGFVILGAIGYFFDITKDSWRWVLLVAASPALLGLLIPLIIPESARWLAQRGKSMGLQARPLRELLGPSLRGRLVLGVLLGAIPVVGTAANANWLTPWSDYVAEQKAEQTKKPDPKAKAVTQMLRSGGATFGSLLGGVLASLLGRRATYFAISLLSLLASTWIFGMLTPDVPLFKVATVLLGFVGVIYFGWLPLYLPELFPTRVRATGTGVSFNTGRIVAGFVVLGTGTLLSLFGGDYANIGLWTGTIYAVGMLLILFAPSTHAAKLED